jgi:radical SAM protein with 4Fe4S-binding SPASM domain
MTRATLDKPNTDTQTSPMDAVYPALQTKSELRKYDNFVILNKWFKQDWVVLHPSEAVMVALFDGRASLAQVGKVWAYIYNQPLEDGLHIAATCFQEYRQFLDCFTEPAKYSLHSFNPKDFIYNVREESQYELAKTHYYTGEKFPVPIELALSLTHQCNFKCEYCYAEVTSLPPSKNNDQLLDLSKCLSLVDEAAKIGVIYVAITGGEPTLFKGWLDVALKILELKMIPVMTTNGSIITRQQLEILASAGMKDLTISLDTSLPNLHHKITSTNGTFKRVVDAISNSVNVGIHTIVKCVVTKSNLENISDFIDFVVSLGVKECGITYMDVGARNSCSTTVNPQIKYEDLIKLREIVFHKREEYQGKCEIWPPKDPKAKHPSGFVPCGGMYYSIGINERGNVNICEKLLNEEEFMLGNIFQQTLEQIWNGASYEKLRQKTLNSLIIDPICQGCNKLNVCRTGCFIQSLIDTGSPFTKDPNCGGPY